MTWTWRPLTRLRYLDSSSCLDKSIVSQLNILVQYKCNQHPFETSECGFPQALGWRRSKPSQDNTIAYMGVGH